MEAVQILIVEDEPIVATDLRLELVEMGFQIAGVASDGETALDLARTETPGLILMDVGLKGQIDGIGAAQQIRCGLGIPVVYLTAFVDEKTLQRAKKTEPFGYLVKPFRSNDLRIAITIALHRHQEEQRRAKEAKEYASKMHAIRAILDNAASIEDPPNVAKKIPSRLPDATAYNLSRREQDVLLQLVRGASGKQIARFLHISQHTVRNHLRALFRKCDVHSQVQLVSKFRGPVVG